MLNLPQFKPHLRVQVVPGEGAFLVSDANQILLKGRLYEHVVPWIGQGRSADDVCAQLQGQVSPAEVYFVLAQLEKNGYLCEVDETTPPAEAALWSEQRIDPTEAARRLRETTVTVDAFGIDPGSFLDLLRSLRVRVETDGMGVVLVDGFQRDELKRYNAESLRTGRPWMLIRPTGREVWLGPLFRPGVTGCWECLAQRLRSNRPVESYLKTKDGGPGETAAVAFSPATLQAAHGLAAHAVATWLARGDLPVLEGKIQVFDLASWKLQAHTLVRLPFCPACGSREPDPNRDGMARPIVLESRPKVTHRDGGHRVVTPEVTLERYGHHVSPITGAVMMLERVGGTASDEAMHVYIAGHNLARRHRSLNHLRGDLRSMSSGKGSTDLQARASGLCEGLERYSAVFRGDEPRRRARLGELGESTIDPADCLLFSARQYRARDAWNARSSHFNFVPVPFDRGAEVDWSPVWSLTRDEARYLPTAFCYFHYPHSSGESFCIADSNGNAAGNTLEEAILQGFFELVERDAVALWWYNRVRRPGVDLARVADPYLDRLRGYLSGRGRELWALDLTTDLGIPVFAALTREVGAPEERILLGFGAHLDPEIALMRAVTEMNQMLANLPQGSPKSGSADALTDPETLHWLKTATLANQPYLIPDPHAPRRDLAASPRSWADDVADDVRACRSIIERQGMEMLVLDQTRPEIGLPVVKVIVPGLRHFWARFAPGRLYDVPVKLGWLSRPTPEDELNPIPMFL